MKCVRIPADYRPYCPQCLKVAEVSPPICEKETKEKKSRLYRSKQANKYVRSFSIKKTTFRHLFWMIFKKIVNILNIAPSRTEDFVSSQLHFTRSVFVANVSAFSIQLCWRATARRGFGRRYKNEKRKEKEKKERKIK